MIYCHEYRTLLHSERVSLLETALKERALPLLQKISTLDGIRELYLSGEEPGFEVFQSCTSALGLPHKVQDGPI